MGFGVAIPFTKSSVNRAPSLYASGVRVPSNMTITLSQWGVPDSLPDCRETPVECTTPAVGNTSFPVEDCGSVTVLLVTVRVLLMKRCCLGKLNVW